MSDRIQFHPDCEEYMSSMGARVVAESGIASDKYHLGKLILRGFKDAPDFVLQIDGGTGDSQTFAEAHERSVRCASSLKNLGLKYQDIIYIVAKNHIYTSIPQYAALYQGYIISLSDGSSYIGDFTNSLSLTNPKVIFCDSDKKNYIEKAATLAGISPKIIVFDEQGNDFNQFLIKNGGDVDVNDFRAADFNPDETIAYLLPTSGSTGVPKASKLTHTNFFYGILNMGIIHDKFPTPTAMTLIFSPMNWFSSVMRVVKCPIWRVTRLHSSNAITWEHACELLKKYRPTFTSMTTAFVLNMVRSAKPGQLDLSSLECMIIGGSFVFPDLVSDIKTQYPSLKVITGLGMSESCGPVSWTLGKTPEDMSCTPTQYVEMQIVDKDTLEVVTEPYKNGELWIRGPSVFKGYYKNLEDTAETLTEDGWLRSGDLVYRNENNGYIFVERIKVMMRYKMFPSISPLEIETVILKHPGIQNVAVTGFYNEELGGDLPVACVAVKDGWEVTAQDVKELVKNTLPDHKQLRGGVLFLKSLPVRPNAKIDRRKLVEIVKTSKNE